MSLIDAVDGSSTRHASAMDVGADKRSHDSEELPMQTITTMGLDIAKSVFQVHCVDAEGNVVLRRQINGATCWHSSRNYHRAWSVSRPAHPRIIGRANSKSLVILCG
jgi:hypothetical protein